MPTPLTRTALGLLTTPFLLLACGPKAPAPVDLSGSDLGPDEAPEAPVAPPPPPPPPSVQQGVESEGMGFQWQVEGDRLRFQMSAPTTGWVRVGFNSVMAQHQANMIVGWVQDGQTRAEDRFAVDPPYIEPDTMHGGKDDVQVISGKEDAGRTQVELSIPLDSGDAWDMALKPGTKVWLILSYADTDALDAPSVVRTAVQITL